MVEGFCAERMRRKQRQIRRRKIIKLVTYVVAMVLAVIFVIRGVIFPIVSRVGGKSTGKSQSVQADAGDGAASNADSNSTDALRQPLKGQSDVIQGFFTDSRAGMRIPADAGIRMQMVHIIPMVLQRLTE